MSPSRISLRNEINDLREARLAATFKSLALNGRTVAVTAGTSDESAKVALVEGNRGDLPLETRTKAL